jgi:hypothetical protein
MGLSGGAIAGIVIGAVAFVIFKSWCMWAVIRWGYRRYLRHLATHGSGDSSDTKLGAWLTNAKYQGSGGKGGSSTGSSVVSSGYGDKPRWLIEAKHIEILCNKDGEQIVLGRCSFGVVYKGLRSGVQPVAVKQLLQADASQMVEFQKEIQMMEQLSFDRNIVQFYGACLAPPHPMLILEFMEGGDLRTALTQAPEELAWASKGKQIAMDIARGLVYLHSQKVVHADLKAKNILLTRDFGTAKIADVGLARMMHSTMNTMNSATGSPAGTFAYAAPEMLMGEKWNEKADVYSFGVLLWELATSEIPVRGQLRPLKVPEECPEAVDLLINKCLAKNPNERPAAKALYEVIAEA